MVIGMKVGEMAESRWGVAIVLLVSSTTFWSVWVAQLLSWGAQEAA